MTRKGFKEYDGYKFEKKIFRIASALILIIVLTSFTLYGFKTNIYLHCPEEAMGGRCDNPLYQTCEEWYCESKILPQGFTHGTKPGWLYIHFTLIAILIIISAFFYNHLVHNKKVSPWK